MYHTDRGLKWSTLLLNVIMHFFSGFEFTQYYSHYLNFRNPKHHTSSTLILNTGVPQGCVLSPLFHSLLTYNCTKKTKELIVNYRKSNDASLLPEETKESPSVSSDSSEPLLLHHREHPYPLCHSLVLLLLCVWPESKGRWKLPNASLVPHSLQKAHIVSDCSHPNHRLAGSGETLSLHLSPFWTPHLCIFEEKIHAQNSNNYNSNEAMMQTYVL